MAENLTSNIEPSTSNIEEGSIFLLINPSFFDVQCSMFPVHPGQVYEKE